VPIVEGCIQNCGAADHLQPVFHETTRGVADSFDVDMAPEAASKVGPLAGAKSLAARLLRPRCLDVSVSECFEVGRGVTCSSREHKFLCSNRMNVIVFQRLSVLHRRKKMPKIPEFCAKRTVKFVRQNEWHAASQKALSR
jgi:hypothetical protein